MRWDSPASNLKYLGPAPQSTAQAETHTDARFSDFRPPLFDALKQLIFNRFFAGGLLPVSLSSVSSVSGLVSSMTDESEELNSSVSR